MAIPKILTDVADYVTKDVSKVVLSELLTSVKGDNKRVIVLYRSEGNMNLICFVHGFAGDPKSTFKPLLEFIIKENELNIWDDLRIGYSTNIMPILEKAFGWQIQILLRLPGIYTID